MNQEKIDPSFKSINVRNLHEAIRRAEEKEIDTSVYNLHEAIRLVEEACQLVDSVMDGSSGQDYVLNVCKNRYEAYGKYGFNQLLGNGNPYDDSLFTLIKKLEGKDND